jgi:hypothetical protein
MVMVINLISVENKIWVMGLEIVQGDAGSSWLVIIPKSKDWFMERPHMKTV